MRLFEPHLKSWCIFWIDFEWLIDHLSAAGLDIWWLLEIPLLDCFDAFNSSIHRKIIAIALLMQKITRSSLFGCTACLDGRKQYWSLKNPCWEMSTIIKTSGILHVTSRVLWMLLVLVICQPGYCWQLSVNSLQMVLVELRALVVWRYFFKKAYKIKYIKWIEEDKDGVYTGLCFCRTWDFSHTGTQTNAFSEND